MIITVSGVAGSGKSTVGKLLAEELGYERVSMGFFQREIAKEKGISILELMKFEEKDPAIDRMIDDKQVKYGRENDNFVMDSWLGAYFIPHAFKVFLECRHGVRVKRILGDNAETRNVEKYTDSDDASNKILAREKSNQKRWIEFYGFDFMDRNNYDLIIDTTDMTPEETVNEILEKIKL